MASQTAVKDVGSSAQKALKPKLQSSDLPSRRLLGKGLRGIVYETMLDGTRYARKDFVEVPKDIFQDEASVLIRLGEHENIVKTYGLTVDDSSCSLVLEYMDDDLLSFLQKRKESKRSQAREGSKNLPGETSRLIDSSLDKFIKERRKKPVIPDTSPPPLELQEALDVMLQIATGMEYLHERNIAHGDLKPRNVLVTYSNKGKKSVKVADFGLVQTKSKSMSFVSRGARKLDMAQWKAPEYLDSVFGHKIDDKSLESDSDGDEDMASRLGDGDWLCRADVYSFAVTFYQILTGEVPYPNPNWRELMDEIVSQEVRPKLPAAFQSKLLHDLLESCWGSPAERPTFSIICKKLLEIIQLEATVDDENPLLIPKHASDIEQALLPEHGQGIEGPVHSEEIGTQGDTGTDIELFSKHSTDSDTVSSTGDYLGTVQIEGGSSQKSPVIPPSKNHKSTTPPDSITAKSAAKHTLNVPLVPTHTWDIEHGMGAGVYDHVGLAGVYDQNYIMDLDAISGPTDL